MIPPISTIVRKLRPLAIQIGFVLYLWHRFSNLAGSSVLEQLVASWNDSITTISSWILLASNDYCYFNALPGSLLFILKFTSTILQDAIAIFGILSVASKSLHPAIQVSEWKELLIHRLFHFMMKVPGFENEMEKVASKVLNEADSMLGKNPDRTIRLVLPKQGLPNDVILEELKSCSRNENNRCESGRVSGTLYAQGGQHSQLMSEVYSLYQWSNPLKPGVWPRVNQCEAEIISMAANFLNAPSPIGCVTSGGTESIFTAIRAHLEYYGTQRGIRCPEIICGSTAHCALNKACQILSIRLVSIDCNDGHTFELKTKQVRKHITSNTIMIFASAPSWPHGVIDPIEELSELAIHFDIGLHVDACLGGFILPFCEDVPQLFDFKLRGVSSVSADTHKYGLATKGTSVILFRSLDLQHAAYFSFSCWSGGLYTTPTIAGSRPGALIACAWAALVTTGESGYRTRAKSIINTARCIADTIRSTKGLRLLTRNPTMVVSFASDEINVYRIKDVMASMGWSLYPLQNPPGLNLCVTENLVVKDFVVCLNVAVDQVRNETTEETTKGTTGIYRAVEMLPTFATEFAIRRFVDASLSP